ncbi:MAG TPA: hypothetical protein VLC07_04205, partial [Solirubrobacterales bacterium]|nr:hypothetical protein [Solirubrobacterales bacterium]
MATAVTRPAQKPVVLLAGFDAPEVAACQQLLREARVEVAEDDAEVLARLARDEVAVLCLGPRISGLPARHLLDEAVRASRAPTLLLLTAAGPNPSLFQELIDEDRIFYLSFEPVPLADLEVLLRSAVERSRELAEPAQPEAAAPGAPGHPLARRTLEVARRLAAQRDLPSCCELLREAAAELTGA